MSSEVKPQVSEESVSPATIHLKGIPASPGIEVGRVALFHPDQAPELPSSISSAQVNSEARALERALAVAEREIIELQKKLTDSLDEAHTAIFDSHLLFVRDPALRQEAERRIRAKHESARTAVTTVIGNLADQFLQMEDEYISSRATDLTDIANRICKSLSMGKKVEARPKTHRGDVILFAHDLTPTDTAGMDHAHVKAFATEIGGPTSHTAILAKALEIAAVVGLGSAIPHLSSGATVIIDGYTGEVTIHPTKEEISDARRRRKRALSRTRDFRKLKALPGETIDKYRVQLCANIEFPSEIDHVIENGADGIGLFRTEFLYLKERRLPSEDEQYQVYREVLERISPGDVIFRTLDVGGDKFLSEVQSRDELNPFLGLRAIRFCLEHPRIFRTQLRALLRASIHGQAKIMFPMVSSVSEVIEAKELLEEAKDELTASGLKYDPDVEIGIMVEIPSAALTADRMAEEVDFFSIGTNDLIQYTLAADRSNEKVASLYNSYHPAVLRLVRMVVDAAHRAGIPVSVCGEMASNPKTAILLVGMGVDELSMGPVSIPEIKYLLRHVRYSEIHKLAGQVLGMNSSHRIREFIDGLHEEFGKRRVRVPRAPAEAASKPDTTGGGAKR